MASKSSFYNYIHIDTNHPHCARICASDIVFKKFIYTINLDHGF